MISLPPEVYEAAQLLGARLTGTGLFSRQEVYDAAQTSKLTYAQHGSFYTVILKVGDKKGTARVLVQPKVKDENDRWVYAVNENEAAGVTSD
jgi:hypothetical protein